MANGESKSYLPNRQRDGIGLCLSGGGFRAALFHLGALRRLNELAILPRVKTISSVSGGSILSAHLATAIEWPLAEPIPPERWEREIAQPFRRFTRHNLRNWPLLKRYLLPWNWPRSSTVIETLIQQYRWRLPALRQPLTELPARPRFVFCATDMAFGVNWIFEQRRMGDYQAGYVSPPPKEWTLAHAVGASSCFPPLFDPLPVKVSTERLRGGRFPKGAKRDACLSGLRLTDGGNYDNMGLEPVWKTHATVLVSDGGGLFAQTPDRGFTRRLLRYAAISDNQSRSLRKRWLMSSFAEGQMKGTFWGIGSAWESYGLSEEPPFGVYSKGVAQDLIAGIRTDLDVFSKAEIGVLENHGYLLAEAAIRCHRPDLLERRPPPLEPPHRQWLGDEKVKKVLAKSGRRKLI